MRAFRWGAAVGVFDDEVVGSGIAPGTADDVAELEGDGLKVAFDGFTFHFAGAEGRAAAVGGHGIVLSGLASAGMGGGRNAAPVWPTGDMQKQQKGRMALGR